MFIFISALAAIVPMATYLIFIWWFDRYDREPFKLVLVNYIWGSFGAIIFAVIGSIIFSEFLSVLISNENQLNFFGTVITAPVVEEITKGAFLFITVTNRKFDNMTDGIVYGGAIGLGFGMTENFLYFVSFGSNMADWIVIVIIRTLFSAVMHCAATATFGAFLGYAKFRGRKHRILYPIIGITLAIIIHFAWNVSVSFKSTAFLGFIFMAATIVILVIVFSASIRTERKIIIKELSPEAENGIIPNDHLLILSSAKRNKRGWINESIRKTYIKAATTLAFRKMQFSYSKGRSREYYNIEIDSYRQFIQDLLLTPG
ncbi:MAG: PrsW family intramembrane metalloprotease [Ignavibacteria bacterium]|jgi:RsiW-degrading membrane proteinase PrsW (M82 family)